MRRLLRLAGAAVIVAGAVAVQVGRWLASCDLHDLTIEINPGCDCDQPDELHVVPRNDLIAHEDNEDCVCGPTVRFVQQADSSNGWTYTHHSLDRREATE